MKLNINYDGLRSLPTQGEQRSALFYSLKAALLFGPIALDLLGATAAAKAATHSKSQMDGPADVVLTVDQVKSYLLSDRANKFGAKFATPGDNPALMNTSSRVVEFFNENIRDMDLGY
ncbi:MAG TPA: hypothetical protein VLF15_01205, partial [Pseudoxanthomonas sp.]|nr:hypothetical protein [Pseudoxanthomonas sp.]